MPNNKVHNKKPAQRHVATCLCVVAVLLLLGGCSSGEKVKFHRLDQLLFTTPADQLEQAMKAHREEYDSELLKFYPEEPEFVQMTKEYAADPVMRDIYHITDSLYGNLSDVERQLGRALARAYKLCPEMPHVERLYAMVPGDFNYDFRIYSNGSDLCVALDMYALGAMEKYQYFGLPQYIVRTMTKEHIAADCMHMLGSLQCDTPDGELTLLDHALLEGKVLYFVEQTMPELADTILLRYTGDQQEWMKRNVANVWAWLIQNKMLYSKELNQYHNLIDDAPHTNAFGNESAPRTVNYIGLQIVRRYMKKSGSGMEELFRETDSQKILTESGWRP